MRQSTVVESEDMLLKRRVAGKNELPRKLANGNKLNNLCDFDKN